MRDLHLAVVGLALLLGMVAAWNVPLNEPTYFSRPATSGATPVEAAHSRGRFRSPLFEDVTARAGIFASHQQVGDRLLGLHEALGAGACILDFDGDGLVDIFFLAGSGEHRYHGRVQWWQQDRHDVLYRNRGDGRFEDVSLRAGFHDAIWGTGCAAGDLDNDGDPDLVVTGYRVLKLYRNDGGGGFKEELLEVELPSDYLGTSISLADFDNDGLLDVYVTGYVAYRQGQKRLEVQAGFEPSIHPDFNPALFDSRRNLLLHNSGGLDFREIGQPLHADDASGRGLASWWEDLDGDARPDLVIVNDKGSPNRVMLSGGESGFREAGGTLGLASAVPTMAVVSLMRTDRSPEQMFLMSTPASYPLLLFRREQKGFRDVARELGLDAPEQMGTHGWGIAVADFDNDGDQDIYVANGHLAADESAPKQALGQPDGVWLGEPQGGFVACGADCLAFTPDRLSARSALTADFDNDGLPEILVTHNNGPPKLLRNSRTGGHWIGISLEGTGKVNRDGIGARVRVSADGHWFEKVVQPAAFLGQNDRRLLFGLGNVEGPVSVTVEWPDGSFARFSEVPVDRYVEIVKDETAPSFPPSNNRDEQQGLRQPTMLAGFRSPVKVAEIAGWLRAHSESRDEAIQLLVEMASSPNDKVRKAVIPVLEKATEPRLASALYAQLDSESPLLRAAAVAAVGRREEEYSIRWLLRGLSDASSEVRCAAAAAFGFFFREEEAMVNSKRLAISRLLELLEDPDPGVVGCAVDALAEAEDYRALRPLLNLLQNHPLVDVRRRAIRALGLLREKEALAAVLAILKDRGRDQGERVQAVIALPRLGFDSVRDLIASLFENAGPSDAKVDLKMLAALLRSPEGTTVAPEDVVDPVLSWAEARRPRKAEVLAALFGVAEMTDPSQGPRFKALAKSYVGHPDATVRRAAMGVWYRFAEDVSERRDCLRRGMADSSASVRLASYELAERLGVGIPLTEDETVEVDGMLLDAQTRWWMATRSEWASEKLREVVSSKELGERLRTKLLMRLWKLDPNAVLELNLPDAAVHSRSIQRQLRRLASIRSQPVAKRIDVARAILAAPDLSDEVFGVVLRTLSEKPTVRGFRVMVEHLAGRKHLSRKEWVAVRRILPRFQRVAAPTSLTALLRKHRDAIGDVVLEMVARLPRGRSVLMEIASAGGDETLRFRALRMSYRIDRQWTLERLGARVGRERETGIDASPVAAVDVDADDMRRARTNATP